MSSRKVALNIISAAKVYADVKIEELDDKRLVPKMMLRRRLTRNSKIMLYIADRCEFTGGKIVYSNAYGELQSTVGIVSAIATDTAISPTLFQNSVYNTPPSYFSLLNQDKDEIITISSGKTSSLEALKTAALQALVHPEEKILCVATECMDIDNIEEVNSCIKYLESGVGVVLELALNEDDAVELSRSEEEGFANSIQDLIDLVSLSESGKKKVFIEL